jgi:uncharacterized alpha-E superfamily protein
MLLRVADHLYWLGRYLERAENTADAVDAACHESLLPGASAVAAWEGLLTRVGQRADFVARYGDVSATNIIEFMLLDLENPASVLSSLRAARENGRSAYATLAPEASESINTLWLELKEMELRRLTLDGVGPCLDRMREGALRIHGGLEHTLVQDEASRMIGLGRLLEKSDHIIRVLRANRLPLREALRDEAADSLSCSKVLRSVGAVEAYRKAYHDGLTPRRVIEFLLLRREIHCSVRACLDRMADGLEPFTDGFGREPKRRVAEMSRVLNYPRLMDRLPDALDDYLVDFSKRLREIGIEIDKGFRVPLCA